MKMELYEPHELGYVSLDPYEWEYNGHYPEIERILKSKPTFERVDGVDVPDGETGENRVNITPEDGEEYLQMLGEHLKLHWLHEYKIVNE
jgi:hypothetical protein